jgi:hypothetical protein
MGRLSGSNLDRLPDRVGTRRPERKAEKNVRHISAGRLFSILLFAGEYVVFAIKRCLGRVAIRALW